MIATSMRELLLEILEDTEALDKITVRIDPVSRTLTVEYEDIDDEWFKDLMYVLRTEMPGTETT